MSCFDLCSPMDGVNRKKHPRASSAWRFETACQRTIAEADVIRPRLSVTLGCFLHIQPCAVGPFMNCASQTPKRDASEDMVPQAGPGSNSQIDCFQCVTALDVSELALALFVEFNFESKQSQWSATQTLHKVTHRRLSQGWPSFKWLRLSAVTTIAASLNLRFSTT